MKKRLKYFLIGSSGIFLLFLIIWAALPLFLKSSLQAQLDQQLAQEFEGNFAYDQESLKIKMFANFPYITINLQNFSLKGEGSFQTDTLLKGEKLLVVINPWSLVIGQNPQLRGVELHKVDIFLHRLANGEANWDILPFDWQATSKPPTQKERKEKASMFPDGLRFWKIKNASITFNDEAAKTFLKIAGIEHESRVQVFSETENLKTKLFSKDITFQQYGTTYYKQAYLNASLRLNFDRRKRKYSFQNADIRLNEMRIKLTGGWQEKGDSLLFDIQYASQGKNLANFISIFPSISPKYLRSLDIKGTYAWNGFLKGTLHSPSKQTPAFNTHLIIQNGFLQFPQLPKAFQKANIDVSFTQHGAGLENMELIIKKFHLNIGKDFITAVGSYKGNTNGKTNLQAHAQLDFATFNEVLPMPFLTFKGKYTLKANINGNYNRQEMPQIDLKTQLSGGFLKVILFPNPLKEVNFKAEIRNKTGKFEDFEASLENFQWQIVEDIFSLNFTAKHWQQWQYNLSTQGNIDFYNLLKTIPVGRVYGRGILSTNLKAEGQLFGKEAFCLPQGQVSLRDFKYEDRNIPQGIRVVESMLRFQNESIRLENFLGFAGETLLKAEGNAQNVLHYAMGLSPDWQLALNINGETLNINDWLPKETTDNENPPANIVSFEKKSSTPKTNITQQNPFAWAKNGKIFLAISLDSVLFENYKIADVQFKTIIQADSLEIERLYGKIWEGTVEVAGIYAPEKDKALVKTAITIANINLEKMRELLQKIAPEQPIFETLKGEFSTEISLQTYLDAEGKLPLTPTPEGSLALEITDFFIENPLLKELPTVLRNEIFETVETEKLSLYLHTDAQKGIIYAPTIIKTPYYSITFAGSQGWQGSLDFEVQVDILPSKNTQDHLYAVLKIGGTTASPDLKIQSVGNQAPTSLLTGSGSP